MSALDHTEREEKIRDLLASGRHDEAVEVTMNLYGAQIMGYLVGLNRDVNEADEAFQTFSLDLWRGLASFTGRSSLRTWLFTVARNAHWRTLRRRSAGGKQVHLDTEAERGLPARHTRTGTALWRRTEARDWLWEQIQSFDSEDRELLVLRLVEQMGWRAIAEITTSDEALDAADLKRRAANLRKRFERLKERLMKARRQLNASGDAE